MPYQMNIPDWVVVATKQYAEHILVSVSVKDSVTLPSCQSCASKLYRDGTFEINNIVDVFDATTSKPVLIKLSAPQYRCRACNKRQKKELTDLALNFRMTKRALRMIEDDFLRRPTNELAERFGSSERTISSIGKILIKRLERGYTFKTPRVLGLDEKTIDGHRRIIAVDMSRDKSPLIDILKDQRKETLEVWLRGLPERFQIHTVVMDGNQNYAIAVRNVLPHATIILDRWHVMQLATAGKRKNDCQDAYRALEQFWESSTRAEAAKALSAWRASLTDEQTKVFGKFLNFYDRRKEDILNYFTPNRLTNAAAEQRAGLIKKIAIHPNMSFSTTRARALFRGKLPNRDFVQCDRCEAYCRDGIPVLTDAWENADGTLGFNAMCPMCIRETNQVPAPA